MRLSEKQRQLLGATLGIVLGNSLSLVLPFVIASWYGTDAKTDAYFFAFGAILFTAGIISGAVEASVAPFVVHLTAESPGVVVSVIRRVALQALAAASALTLVGLVLIDRLVIPHSGFQSDGAGIVLEYLLILSPIPALDAAASVFAGALYGRNRYLSAASSDIIRPLIAIIAGSAFRREGIVAVSIGLVVGEALRAIGLYVYFRSVVGEQTRQAALQPQNPTRALWRTVRPQTIALVLGGLSPLIDKVLASSAGPGSLTRLELAQRLSALPVRFIVSGTLTVMTTSWAERIARGEWMHLRSAVQRTAVILTVGGTLYAGVTASSLWFGRGTVATYSRVLGGQEIALLYVILAGSIPLTILAQVGVRFLTAARVTRPFPFISTGSLVVNVVGDFVLLRLWGIAGIALSSLLVTLHNVVLVVVISRRHMAKLLNMHRPRGMMELDPRCSQLRLGNDSP